MAVKKVPTKIVEASPCGEVCRELSEQRGRVQKLFRELEACFVSKEDSGEWVLDPSAVMTFASKARTMGGLTPASLSALESWARESAIVRPGEWEAKLRALCQSGGVSLEGRFPKYRINGIVIRLSEDGRSCEVGGRDMGSFLPARVWNEARRLIEEDREQGLAPAALLSALQRAYARAASVHQVRIGQPVPVRQVLRELVVEIQGDRFWQKPTREHWRSYTEEQFQRDLSRLLAERQFSTPDGYRLEVTPTSFPKNGLAVLDGDGVRYIGGVMFACTEA